MKSIILFALALITVTLGACAQQNAPTTSTTQSASRTSTYSK